MKEKTIKLSRVKPYPNNPRDNTAAIEKVRESIERFGYLNPIIVDGKNVVVAGHTRLEALKAINAASPERFDTIKVLVADDLTPEQIRQFRIADNKAAEQGTWDNDALIAELRTIEAPSDSMRPFFHESEFERMMAQLQAVESVQSGPTQDQIDRAEDIQRTAAADKSDEAARSHREIVCKHCGEKFFV